MVCSHGVSLCSSALLSVLLLVLIVTMTTGQDVKNENPCLREGGICVFENSCKEGNKVNKTGLCAEQEKNGVICCNGVPEEEESCRLHGGRCGEQEECAKVQEFGQLDCPEGTRCCLLIF